METKTDSSPKGMPGLDMPGNAEEMHPDERVYPEHEQIREWMMDLVAGNIEGSEE